MVEVRKDGWERLRVSMGALGLFGLLAARSLISLPMSNLKRSGKTADTPEVEGRWEVGGRSSTGEKGGEEVVVVAVETVGAVVG